MSSAQDSAACWGSSFRMTAAERWRIPSGRMGRGVTDALVDYAAPRPGLHVLDLATGTGEPGITIAGLVAPSGSVTALDQSEALLKIATERARQRGLTNFAICHADAHQLPFPDASFDLATCRFGVMFFDDVPCAFGELRRVLRPGARACFAAWGPFEQPYFAATMGVVLRHVGGQAISPGAADPYRFSAPGSLSHELRSAGFAKIHEETRTVPWVWPGSPEELWEYARAVAAPCKPLLERVPAPQWSAITADVLTELGKLYDGKEIKFGATIVLASGAKA
jgi:ubiquinone/menaquinone biosynthesis C-methylase UbiE